MNRFLLSLLILASIVANLKGEDDFVPISKYEIYPDGKVSNRNRLLFQVGSLVGNKPIPLKASSRWQNLQVSGSWRASVSGGDETVDVWIIDTKELFPFKSGETVVANRSKSYVFRQIVTPQGFPNGPLAPVARNSVEVPNTQGWGDLRENSKTDSSIELSEDRCYFVKRLGQGGNLENHFSFDVGMIYFTDLPRIGNEPEILSHDIKISFYDHREQRWAVQAIVNVTDTKPYAGFVDAQFGEHNMYFPMTSRFVSKLDPFNLGVDVRVEFRDAPVIEASHAAWMLPVADGAGGNNDNSGVGVVSNAINYIQSTVFQFTN